MQNNRRIRMKLTDLEIAEFCGVTDATLRNWKKPKVEGGVKFYPPYGRHNLYKGAKMAAYLLKYTDNGEEAEHFNNLELLTSNAEALEDYLKMLQRDDLEESVKKSLLKSGTDACKTIKKIIGNIKE